MPWRASCFFVYCHNSYLKIFFARPFGITADVDGVDYKFTSKDYAVDFAKQNIDAMWVKVNGEFINQ